MAGKAILDDTVDPADLKQFEAMYASEARKGFVTEKTKFTFALCLVRSKSEADIKKGVRFLEELFTEGSADARRDYLYYMAVGFAKIKDYDKAIHLIDGVLSYEPANHQALNLKAEIQKRRQQDGFIGMAIVGGIGAVAVAGLVSLGIALSKK